ncbi:MAG: hypothetical protein M1497_02965 [Nitrospirae bacterium]|nr:hypothetical protein [Nitrospirota bacterium]
MSLSFDLISKCPKKDDSEMGKSIGMDKADPMEVQGRLRRSSEKEEKIL